MATRQTLTLAKPDDWHLHLRDGEVMAAVLPQTTRCFARAMVMPNLHPPIATVEQAVAYRGRILEALPPGARFTPLMALYLSDAFDATQVAQASRSGCVHGVKLYPKGIATAGQPGVSAIERCYPALAAMEEHDLPLLVHGEVTSTLVDIFDRERTFLDETLAPLVARFPRLRIVLEHISTTEAVRFVEQAPPNVAATVTVHHMLMNRNSLFEGGIRPHHYCIPVLKRESHRAEVLRAATSGNPKFFLGTDSAPHLRHTKENACGCAGAFTAHAAIELYAEAFEMAGALERLEGFASHHGADFYRLPRNTETITLERGQWPVAERIAVGEAGEIVPLRAGGTVAWRLRGTGPQPA